MIKLNYEDWKKQYLRPSPELEADLKGMFPLDAESELEKIYKHEFEIYEKNFIDALVDALHINVVNVNFKKVDGSDRKMLCTLNPMHISKDKMPKLDISKVIENEKESSAIKVFEINLQEWRSFRKDSVIDWEILSV